PMAVPSRGHERLPLPRPRVVEPARYARTRQGARHRVDARDPALVERAQARHLNRLAPSAVPLGDHEPLLMTVAVGIEPPGRAIARRTTRCRVDARVPALIQRTQARRPNRLAPTAI